MAKKRLIESRRSDRVSAGWRVLVPRNGGQTAEGRISDVSATGLLFTAPIQYRKGEKISLDIITSPKNFVRSRIVILREDGRQNGVYSYGAKFINMSNLDRNLLEGGMDDAENAAEISQDSDSAPGKRRNIRSMFTWFRDDD